MNRRSFLRLAGLGPALLALQHVPLSLVASAARAAPAGQTLEPHEAALVLAIAERMLRTGDAAAPSAKDLGVVMRVESLLAELDRPTVAAVKTALDLVDWWPATVEMRFKRFLSLSPEEMDESLEGWRQSSLATRRRVFYALRSLALFAYWSDPRTWPLIGYEPWSKGSDAGASS